ncbi:MAG TPA: CopD family protein [Puia sp.]|nr:CopD family protein [Puia sp.]
MLYLKALHIIFIVTWFAGMFYMPRLFIYNTEAETKTDEVKKILHEQFAIMMKRLWFGIAIPSALLTLMFGPILMFAEGWNRLLFDQQGRWLLIKLIFVLFLYLYFLSLHTIFKQQLKGVFKYSSQQLRIWNEVATVFLVAIVMIAVVRESMSLVWGLVGLALFVVILIGAIKIYKLLRSKQP